LEGSEAVGASLTELHLSAESVDDAVALVKSPHGGDIDQLGEDGRGKGEHGRELASLKKRGSTRRRPPRWWRVTTPHVTTL
jgi:hypothetical protein